MTLDSSTWQPDLHSAAYQEDPAPTLRRLRQKDPVHRSRHGYWFLTRYRDVKGALRDARFSSDWSERRGGRPLSSPFEESERDRANRTLILSSFNMRDGEGHTRIRALVNQAFSKGSLESRRERIEALADELLPPAAAGFEFDLVQDFGFPLPAQISCEMIGIPSEARDRFRTSFEEAGILGLPKRSAKQHAIGLAALDWQVAFVSSLLEERRKEPKEDLLTALVEAEQDGERLTNEEAIAAIVTIFTAAGTTTERFVSSGLYLLLQHPDELARLREEPALLGSALEEILRYHHPDQSTTTPRWVTEDTQVGDTLLKRGDRVRFGLGAANRDPEEFTDPERFDIARSPNRHLAFGRGAHFCLGATLARIVGEVAISAVLRRYDRIELATEAPRRDPRRMDRYEELRVRV
jgi:cytochrome P450